jgi:hypothetical protein
MPLIDDVKVVCDRLAPLGWRSLLKHVTGNQLDIQQATPAALSAQLAKTLTAIDRTVAGFSDFSLDGNRGITPSLPGQSLLFHALASPGVAAGLAGFPTQAEIETVENYVFGVLPTSLAQLRTRAGLTGGAKLTIVVFAYEYRPARDTCARVQADFAFSRTGVARVGTREAMYDARNRGFQSEVPEDPFAFRVCPARYGAFLAVRRKGNASGHMRPKSGDGALDFWIPVHKLFNGRECISGLELELQFSAFHYNDKIRRTRTKTLGMTGVPTTAPFQFSAGIAAISINGLVTPEPHPRLVEPAMLNGQFVTYAVPPAQSGFAALEPGAASDASTGAEVRPAPAYVHARTEVRNGVTIDLNQDATRPDVLATVSKGKYKALHYVDFTGDGFVDVQIPALGSLPAVAATTVPCYSLVAAPDFFPSAGQRELFEAVPADLWGVAPFPLCDTRLPANLQMPGNRFDAGDKTISAIVPLLGPAASGTVRPLSSDAFRHSCLPDDCAGIYAPGWDVSTDKKQVGGSRVHHLAAYGLGSPFPEDSKLCAALSTFWPSVAPDASRGMSPNTGNAGLRATVAPLTDEEIGQSGSLPWDGIVGPHIVTIDGTQFAECDDFLHVDYVQQALDGRFSPRLTARVTSDEYMSRMEAMALVYNAAGGDRNARFVLSFRKMSSGDPELQRAQLDTSAVLTGPVVYRVDLITGGSATQRPHPSDFRKKLLPLDDRRFFLIDPGSRVVLLRRATQTLWTRAVIA